MAKQPRQSMPPNTCPDIDSVISLMEELRAANETLRAWAHYWEAMYEESKDDLQEIESTLEDRINHLESEVSSLEGQIDELKRGAAVTDLAP